MGERPVRLQLSRRKGFNLQELSRATNGLEAVVVTRCSKKWGNPYRVGMFREYGRAEAVADFEKWHDGDYGARVWAGAPPSKKEIRDELGGKNLACSCPVDDGPCHANYYLRIANHTKAAG